MWSCCVCIGSAPQLHQLLCLRLGDKQLKLVQSVAADWKQLGVMLELNYDVLQSIQKNNRFICEDCCLEVLHKWLSGEGCQPITWERLVQALKDLGLTALAAQLHELLSC